MQRGSLALHDPSRGIPSWRDHLARGSFGEWPPGHGMQVSLQIDGVSCEMGGFIDSARTYADDVHPTQCYNPGAYLQRLEK
jgi:hypothetical protein